MSAAADDPLLKRLALLTLDEAEMALASRILQVFYLSVSREVYVDSGLISDGIVEGLRIRQALDQTRAEFTRAEVVAFGYKFERLARAAFPHAIASIHPPSSPAEALDGPPQTTPDQKGPE